METSNLGSSKIQINLNQVDLVKHLFDLTNDFNQEKTTKLPIKIRFSSNFRKLDSAKPIALIIGELHPGACVNTALGTINYFQSNSSITNFLLKLLKDDQLKIRHGLKEGSSKITTSEELEDLSLDEFLVKNYSPAITCTNLLAKEVIKINFAPAESEALLSMFSIMSYLLCSFPGECKSVDMEQKRILDIFENFSPETLKLIPLQLREMSKEIFINLEPFSNLIRPVKTEFGFDLLTLRHQSLLGTFAEEMNDLKLLIKSKLKLLCYERDKFIMMNFMKFESGIHPILVGELHTANLIQLLEDQGVFCVYFSSL